MYQMSALPRAVKAQISPFDVSAPKETPLSPDPKLPGGSGPGSGRDCLDEVIYEWWPLPGPQLLGVMAQALPYPRGQEVGHQVKGLCEQSANRWGGTGAKPRLPTSVPAVNQPLEHGED